MKITEKRWMHLRGKYRIVTVTWDEPEWEEVEVVRWVVVNTSDKSECFTSQDRERCA